MSSPKIRNLDLYHANAAAGSSHIQLCDMLTVVALTLQQNTGSWILNLEECIA